LQIIQVLGQALERIVGRSLPEDRAPCYLGLVHSYDRKLKHRLLELTLIAGTPRMSFIKVQWVAVAGRPFPMADGVAGNFGQIRRLGNIDFGSKLAAQPRYFLIRNGRHAISSPRRGLDEMRLQSSLIVGKE
jgi:hypothetical protein